MTTKLTVSIGIPAYNEAQNIKRLLEALLLQRQESFMLEKIIVVSDGSTDRTVEQVQSVVDGRIQLIDSRENVGLASAQNKILDLVSSDVVVMLDADVLPVGMDLVEDMVTPMIANDDIGLVSADQTPANPRNLLESFLVYGHHLRSRLFRGINSGDNLYLCRGTARALRRDFYEKLRWPETLSEDVYSYLKCRELGFRFLFLPETHVLVRTPLTLRDHAKQSNRYRMGRRNLERLFPSRMVREQYAIPIRAFFTALVLSFSTHPMLTFGYMTATMGARVYKWVWPVRPHEYEIAETTKKLYL